jgi:hypothetical protein
MSTDREEQSDADRRAAMIAGMEADQDRIDARVAARTWELDATVETEDALFDDEIFPLALSYRLDREIQQYGALSSGRSLAEAMSRAYKFLEKVSAASGTEPLLCELIDTEHDDLKVV